MNKKVVVIERVYEASIKAVWEAITNKDQMKDWYFDVTDFKAEVGFEFQFSAESGGRSYLHRCRVVEANPITRVAYTWRYEGYEGLSLVVFELFSEDKERTRLKLTHSDLDTLPEGNPDFAQGSFMEGWKSLLGGSLRKFLEKNSFTESIRINAHLKDIWKIVLNPDNQWGLAFGGGATAETDWKVGSPIIWRDLHHNIGANGVVEVHESEVYLQLRYYDDVSPKPDASLGDYCERYRVVPDKDEYVLSIEIGKIERRDVAYHQRMWHRAINIIKELAER